MLPARRYPHILCLTANEKDFSLSLEMTMLDSGILVSQPSPLGKGDRAAVDRVLSYIVDLRRSFPLSFIPLEPYPARSARPLPHAGKALSVGILFPHMRVFVLTMREKRHPRFAAFPIGEGGPRSGG